MSDTLTLLIGRRINKLQEIHDYHQVFFQDGSILNIFNVHLIDGAINPKLTGYEIASAEQDEEGISLGLSPEGLLRIGMADSDYKGPEAMEYLSNDGARVVWP